MADQNWWYKAKFAHKAICFSLIGSEGPSTWTLLTLAAVDFHQERIDQTFDDLVTRYSNGKGKAKKWENLRQPFDTLWPLMRADYEGMKFQEEQGHLGGLASAEKRRQSALQTDQPVQEAASDSEPEVAAMKPWDDSKHDKKLIFPVWKELHREYRDKWPKQIQSSNYLDFQKAVGAEKLSHRDVARAIEIKGWVVNFLGRATNEEGIRFPDLMKLFADGAMPPLRNQPALEVGGDDCEADFEQPEQPVAGATYDDEEDFG